MDVSSAVAREYAKNLETGDAYLIIGTELNKVKIIKHLVLIVD